MKPRQTSRSFHHNPPNAQPTLPPYQTPLMPSNFTAPPLPATSLSSSQTAAATLNPVLPPALRDVDLSKLGINFENKSGLLQHLTGTTNTNNLSQDDIMKCLQAIYGKNGADILQNQSGSFNDLIMQSISPPDHHSASNVCNTTAPNSTNVSATVNNSGGSGGGYIGSGFGCDSSASISSGSGAVRGRDNIINSGLSSVSSNSSSNAVNVNGAGSSSNSAALITGTGGGASGAASFNNNISKNNNGSVGGSGSGYNVAGAGQKNKHDILFRNAQQHHAATTSSAINNFRVPTTDAYQSPSSSLLQPSSSHQKKSVLTIHQQQQQHHQGESNRFNNHLSQQQISSKDNILFNNLNTLTNMSGTSSSSTSSTISTTHNDVINPSSHNKSNDNQSSYSPNITTLSSTQVMIEALKNQSSLENLIESGLLSSAHHGIKDNINSNISNNSQQQQGSLTGHQQLQRLLKASGGVGSSSSANQTKSQSHLAAMASTLNSNLPNQRNDPQMYTYQQRSINANIMSQSSNNHRDQAMPGAISPTQVSKDRSHLPPPPPPSSHTISKPRPPTSHSLPKSLLNLAACSTTHRDHGSKLSALNQLTNSYSPNLGSRNPNNNKSGYNGGPNKLKNHSGSSTNMESEQQKLSLNAASIDPNELLQQILNNNTRSPLNFQSTLNNPTPSQARTKNQAPLSLLSDDQSLVRNNFRHQQQQNSMNPQSNQVTMPRSSSHLLATSSQYKQPAFSHHRQDDSPMTNLEPDPKDYFLANLQERAARAGVSIDEINDNKSLLQSTANQLSTSISVSASSTPHIVPNELLDTIENSNNNGFDPKEIESALSRVGARNDLSLLYPPMLLGPNSQKQLNALSAGLFLNEESESFTSEVKQIVLEQCNIIYECKQCSNLFRSLANLVKHKRTFCNDSILESQQQQSQSNNNESKRTSSRTLGNQDMLTPRNRQAAHKLQSAIESNQNYDRKLNQDTRTNYAVPTDPATGSGYNPLSRRSHQADIANSLLEFYKSSPTNRQTTHRSMNFDNRERGINSLRNLAEQTGIPSLTTNTSLSKLLRSQPRSRLPVACDNSALMNALRNKSSSVSSCDDHLRGVFSSGSSSGHVNEPIDKSLSGVDLNEQLVSKSSLAKTLLSANAKSSAADINANQTPQDQTNAGLNPTLTNQQSSMRHVASKRKLEDCISKVKRGKLVPNDGSTTSDAVDTIPEISTDDKQQLESDTNEIATNSTSSSALLRALTKPAEGNTKSSSTSTDVASQDKKHATSDKGSSILAKPQVAEIDSDINPSEDIIVEGSKEDLSAANHAEQSSSAGSEAEFVIHEESSPENDESSLAGDEEDTDKRQQPSLKETVNDEDVEVDELPQVRENQPFRPTRFQADEEPQADISDLNDNYNNMESFQIQEDEAIVNEQQNLEHSDNEHHGVDDTNEPDVNYEMELNPSSVDDFTDDHTDDVKQDDLLEENVDGQDRLDQDQGDRDDHFRIDEDDAEEIEDDNVGIDDYVAEMDDQGAEAEDDVGEIDDDADADDEEDAEADVDYDEDGGMDDDDDEDDDDDDDHNQDEPKRSSSRRLVDNSISTPVSTGSGSSASGSGGGGGMKLKIQLKTEPDEKTKVYRIV